MKIVPIQIMSLATCLLVTSCATIVSKSDYPVTVNSTPSGATVTIRKKSDGSLVSQGTTPHQATLKSGRGYFKSETYLLDFKKPGYPTRTTELAATMDGWYAGNILFGGLIGILIVDPMTGAMWKLNKNVDIDLASRTALKITEPGLHVLRYQNIPSEWEGKLSLLHE